MLNNFAQNETIHCGICDKNVMLYATPVKDKRRYCPYCGNFPLWPQPITPTYSDGITLKLCNGGPEQAWTRFNAPAYSD